MTKQHTRRQNTFQGMLTAARKNPSGYSLGNGGKILDRWSGKVYLRRGH